MKINILATAILLPILGFSYEVNFNKSFSKIVNPDLITSSINISVEKKDEKSVNNEIEIFNKFLKDNKSVSIKNVNYTLSPKYDYINNKTEFKGYIADTRFIIESKDAQKINIFLNELISLKDSSKSDSLKLNISNLSWEISSELQNKNFDDLRLESLNWIDKYSKELSSKIVKKCEIKNVNIYENINFIQQKTRMVSTSIDSSNNDIIPLNNEQTMSINTNFILDCK